MKVSLKFVTFKRVIHDEPNGPFDPHRNAIVKTHSDGAPKTERTPEILFSLHALWENKKKLKQDFDVGTACENRESAGAEYRTSLTAHCSLRPLT